MVRGQGEGPQHGYEVDGRYFFGAEDAKAPRFSPFARCFDGFPWLFQRFLGVSELFRGFRKGFRHGFFARITRGVKRAASTRE